MASHRVYRALALVLGSLALCLSAVQAQDPVIFTAHPAGTSQLEGTSLNLSATITSSSTASFQWFLNDKPLAGATATAYTKGSVAPTDAGVYTLVATNAVGKVASNPALVVISPLSGRSVAGQAITGRPALGGNGPRDIVPLPDGGALIGGTFPANIAGNVPQAYLIRVRADGSTDPSFTLALNDGVMAMLRQPDGKILIAGRHTPRLLRLNADLSQDTDFNANVGNNFIMAGHISSLALDSLGRVYAGVDNRPNSAPLYRFSSTGIREVTYNVTANHAVMALGIQSDDKLLVGGYYTTIAGSSASRFARLNIDGTRDTTFTNGMAASYEFADILQLQDGRIWVGGGIGAGAAIAHVSNTGSLTTLIASGNLVYDLEQAPNDKVVVSRASAAGDGSLTRYTAANALDTSFFIGTGPNGDVCATAHNADGSIWVGGVFTTFNGVATGGVVKLQGDPVGPGIVNVPVAVGANAGTTARLSVGAVGTGLSFQWLKAGAPLVDGSNISGATTAVLTVANVSASDDALYSVEVTGGSPVTMVTTPPVKLNLLAAPVVVTSPGNVTLAPGSTVNLSAKVLAATPATYVWTRNGVVIANGGRYAGAHTETLVITGANNGDNGDYVLTVTNGLGTASTVAATVFVNQLAADRDESTQVLGNAGTNNTDYINAILHLPDGRTLIGSRGNMLGNGSTNVGSNLTVYSAAGVATGPAAGNFGGPDAEVMCLFLQPDGKILVGGNFTKVGLGAGTEGPGRNRIARLNADLTLDTTFTPSGPDTMVRQVIADSLGRVYIAGGIYNYEGQAGYSLLIRLRVDGSLDTSFKPQISGRLNSLILQPDNKILVAGDFGSYGPVGSVTHVPGMMRFNADGSVDASFNPILPANNSVVAAVDSSGRIIAGVSASTPVIVRLLANGSVDPNFTFSETLSGPVSVLTTQPDGKVLVGGNFSFPGDKMFRLLANGNLDLTFNPGATGLAGSGAVAVRVITQDNFGRFWIGGSGFTTYRAATARRLVVLQGDGPILRFIQEPGNRVVDAGAASVQFTATATGNNGFTFQWYKDGEPLTDGGDISGATTGTLSVATITTADAGGYSVGITSPSATLTSRTALLTVLSTPEITQDPVAQTVDFGDNVTFTAAGTGAATLTYQWFHGSTALTNGTGVAGATTPTLTLSNVTFGRAGAYTLRVSNSLGSDISAEAVLTVQRRPGALASSGVPTFNGEVNAIQLLDDGSYLVGGSFSTVTVNGAGVSRGRLVHILANGSVDLDFVPTLSGTVYAIAKDNAGRIFVAGDFTSITLAGTTTRTRVLRLTSGLALDTAFDTSTAGPDKVVRALAPVGDGSVYIGGDFDAIGGSSTGVRAIARLKANGSVDTAFKSQANSGSPAVNDSGDVNTILRLSDGSLIVGGSVKTWRTAGGTAPPTEPSAKLMKLSATGARTKSYLGNVVETFSIIVNQVIQLKDGSLVVASNNFGTSGLKRINTSTGADMGLEVTGHLSQANAVAQDPNDKLLSGALGTFFRTDLTGAKDASFDLGTGFNSGMIKAIKVDAAGRIYVGGAFTTFNGQPRNRFAILNGGAFESRNGLLPAQTITFAPLPERSFTPGANSFTVSATASSNLPVSFAVTGGPATISGNTVTVVGTGTVTVTATQAGNDEFSAAPPVSRSFAVTVGSQTLQFANIPSRSALSPAFVLNATASSGLPVAYEVVLGPATVSGNLLTLTGAVGTVTLRATQAGNANVGPATPVLRSFEATSGPVVQMAQTLTFNQPANRYISESPLDLGISASSGLPVTVTVVSGPAAISGNGLVLTGAGKVTVRASQSGNANFKAAADVTRSFTVLAAPTVLTLTNLAQTYTGTPRSIGYLGVAGGTSVTLKYNGSETPPTNAGSYAVEAVAGTVKKTGKLVISKAPLTVTADDKRRLAGLANPELTLTYTGFVAGDTVLTAFSKPVTVTTTAKQTSPGGLYAIKPSGGASANYAPVYVSGTLTVDGFAGLYEALLTTSGSRAVAKVELNVAASSTAFTGKISTGTELAALPIKGSLVIDADDQTATGTASFSKGSNSYQLTFVLPLTGDFEASLKLNNVTLGGTEDGKKLLVLAKGQTLSHIGAHTLVLRPGVPVEATTETIPVGSGHATAVMDAKGVLKLTGKLADGTVLTASLVADADAGYRLFIQPYKRLQSYVAGALTMEDHPVLTGRKYVKATSDTQLDWVKAAEAKDKSYRSGIALLTTQVVMDPWLPPVNATKTASAITLAQRLGLEASGDFDVDHSTLASSVFANLPTLASVDAKNKVTVKSPVTSPVNSTKWTVTLTPATGAFVGSFSLVDTVAAPTPANPAATKVITRPVPFSGVLRQPASDSFESLIGTGNLQLPALPTAETNEVLSGEILFQLPD